MSEECFLDGLQCPAQNIIDRQLMRAQIIRVGLCRLALGDMALADELVTVADPIERTDLQKRLGDVLVQKEAAFADIDSAEALLHDTSTALKEACADGQPYIADEAGETGRRVLHCASTRATELMPRHAFMVLKENE